MTSVVITAHVDEDEYEDETMGDEASSSSITVTTGGADKRVKVKTKGRGFKSSQYQQDSDTRYKGDVSKIVHRL
jgi:hypothetical protein